MTVSQLVALLILVVLIGAVIALFVPHNGSRTRPDSQGNRQLAGPALHDDDRNWYGGVFYNNPDDPNPLVPRRYGFGWTVNFGHPLGKLFIAILIAMMLLPIVLAIFNPGLAATGCHPNNCHLSP